MQPIITSNHGPDILLTPINANNIKGVIPVENLPEEAVSVFTVNAEADLSSAIISNVGCSFSEVYDEIQSGKAARMHLDVSGAGQTFIDVWAVFAVPYRITFHGIVDLQDGTGSLLLSALFYDDENIEAYISQIGGGGSPNILPYATDPEFSGYNLILYKDTSVYRFQAPSTGGTTYRLPGVTNGDIPSESSFYCFEMEVYVPSDITGFAYELWDWIEEPPYDPSVLAGATLFIACRYDCDTGDVTANTWRVKV